MHMASKVTEKTCFNEKNETWMDLSRMLFLQLIWEGATGAVHAKVDAEDPKIIQNHHPKSDFQNADTYKRPVCCSPQLLWHAGHS